ncbi:uncharacterized protein LOC117102842 isoform X2 [Anneissia japonica]|uniref:uncharacterized protein LOC117102842 isoform X2 n=1 Tax=Anneissia japonica TaxID=1529436 RepID=UPI0014257B5A|nr:uncharacterized protein LOC117102842 isoform X2 [Anneissia japonica]
MIPVPGPTTTVEKVLVNACKSLGIHQHLAKYFGLFQESANSFRKLKNIEYISSETKGLTLRKWCFDLEDEKILMEIEGALLLLYHEAKQDVATGRLLPDDETKAKLDELVAPTSETYTKYVSICQDIEDYFAVEIKSCYLSQDFKIKSFQLSRGVKYSIVLFVRGLKLRVDKTDFLISWRKVSSWSCVEDDRRIQFEVYSPTENNYRILAIETADADYMLTVVMELIRNLQNELDGPMFETSDLTMDSSGKVVKWSNVLFATRRFNAEDELASKCEDLTS